MNDNYLMTEGFTYNTQQDELSMLPLKMCRLVTSSIQFELVKRVASMTFFNNIHTATKCISIFEYSIGADDINYVALVVCSIMYAYSKIFFEININD